MKNIGHDAWPQSTILCLDDSEKVQDGINPFEIPVGAVPPKETAKIKGIPIKAPMKPGEHIFNLSLKSSKYGDFFGQKLYLIFNVIKIDD